MRHVPPVEYLIHKIDVDYRSRIERLLRAFEEVRTCLRDEDGDRIAAGFAALARAIERFSELLHGGRIHHPDEIRARIDAAFANATHALLSADPQTFRVRAPENQFERSQGEPVLGAFLVITDHVKRLTDAVAAIAPNVWEELLGGMVVKEHPVNEETLQPIA